MNKNEITNNLKTTSDDINTTINIYRKNKPILFIQIIPTQIGYTEFIIMFLYLFNSILCLKEMHNVCEGKYELNLSHNLFVEINYVSIILMNAIQLHLSVCAFVCVRARARASVCVRLDGRFRGDLSISSQLPQRPLVDPQHADK